MKNEINCSHFLSSFLMFVLSALFFSISPSQLLAQTQELKFTNFTIEDGLSHSKVNCIYQDSQGFLWFGTNEGLNKYDGYNFTVFLQDPDDPHSLSANLIRCILEDSKGNFWVGTEAGGLNRYDRDSKSFAHFTTDSTSELVLNGNNINSIIEDDQDKLWLGTNHGVDVVDWEQKWVKTYLPFSPNSTRQISNEVLVVYEDRQQLLWLGTLEGGLCSFDRRTAQFSYFQNDPNDETSIGDNEIRSIAEDSQGNLWIGTTCGGLNLFDRKSNRFERFYPDLHNSESTTIRAILDDGNGNLWIGNRSGLYNFNRKTHSFTHYAHDLNNPNCLVQNSIQTIFKDAKGDLWIGTRGGISYLNTSNLPFIHYRADANNPRCLNKRSVYTILEDHGGDLWFGTENGGLNCLNRKSGLFTYLMSDFSNPNSLSVNNIKALLEDRFGNLWIGTYNGGLNVFKRNSNHFVHYLHDAQDPSSLSIDNVLALLEDKNGTIWIGTFGGGLDRFDNGSSLFNNSTKRAPGHFVHVLEKWHDQGFYNIHCLLMDKKDQLWMGASQGKIGCLEIKSGKFTPYQLNHNMNNVDVRSIFKDSDGNLWFGTVGMGLYWLDPKEKTFKAFTKKDGLPSNIVYGILQDRAGNLWLSTTNGLCRFNPKTGNTKNYFKENGLQSDQFNYNACLQTRDGELFFGGINGVTAFYPENIQENSYVPPVVITDFKIFNKPVEIQTTTQTNGQRDYPILTRDISKTKLLKLSYKHAVFSFEFVALNYAISEQNQYAYMMEGFEEDWNYVGTRRFATYTNLDPGEYTFRVKAANNDGLWNEQGASIKITISSPFWKTLWFKLVVVALALLTIKHFIDYLRQKRNLLKAKSLANLAQLKLLRNQMNPHFLFNALGSIRSMILISKEKAWDMVSELSEFFRYTMLNFNKVEALLDDEVSAVHNYLNIEKVRYKDSLQVSFTIEDDARKCVVPAFLCQPLIENAIKYGMQSSQMPLKVDIAIAYQRDILSIDVSNTGKLNNPDHRTSEKADPHGTSLENIRQRLGIMFQDQFTFQLFEDNGWVHAKIRINCQKKKRAKFFIPEEVIGH